MKVPEDLSVDRYLKLRDAVAKSLSDEYTPDGGDKARAERLIEGGVIDVDSILAAMERN